MTSLLAANPKIDGVFAINDPTAIGADLAAKQAQRNEFFIVGVDGSPDGEEALKRENSLFVATPQDPQVMAAKAVEIGYDILQGKPAPKEPVLIPVTMIDKKNVGTYRGGRLSNNCAARCSHPNPLPQGEGLGRQKHKESP